MAPAILFVVVILLVSVLTVAGWRLLAGQKNQSGTIYSCRSHAFFIIKTLDEQVYTKGWLPFEPGLPGEELFCRLDFHGHGENCHAGAPQQRHGGWQMVNASLESWGNIFEEMKGQPIPILWCGRGQHAKGDGLPPDNERVVVAINGNEGYTRTEIYNAFRSAREGQQLKDEWNGQILFTESIFYMQEKRLAELLTRMNAILMKNGEPATPMNVQGRSNYLKIAEPYQTDE